MVFMEKAFNVLPLYRWSLRGIETTREGERGRGFKSRLRLGLGGSRLILLMLNWSYWQAFNHRFDGCRCLVQYSSLNGCADS